MGRGRNQRNSRNGMTCLGNHIVHLESRKLSPFTRFRTLRYLNLNLIRIHQIFRRHTKTPRSHLLDGTSQGTAIRQRLKT